MATKELKKGLRKGLRKNKKGSTTLVEPSCSRDDWIRTSDHTPPRRVL